MLYLQTLSKSEGQAFKGCCPKCFLKMGFISGDTSLIFLCYVLLIGEIVQSIILVDHERMSKRVICPQNFAAAGVRGEAIRLMYPAQ